MSPDHLEVVDMRWYVVGGPPDSAGLLEGILRNTTVTVTGTVPLSAHLPKYVCVGVGGRGETLALEQRLQSTRFGLVKVHRTKPANFTPLRRAA